MNNAELIIKTLDGLLNAPVELTLYGRAARVPAVPEIQEQFALSSKSFLKQYPAVNG